MEISATGGSSGLDGQAGAAIAQMEAAFQKAIATAAKVLEVSTDGNSALGALRARPQ